MEDKRTEITHKHKFIYAKDADEGPSTLSSKFF